MPKKVVKVCYITSIISTSLSVIKIVIKIFSFQIILLYLKLKLNFLKERDFKSLALKGINFIALIIALEIKCVS